MSNIFSLTLVALSIKYNRRRQCRIIIGEVENKLASSQSERCRFDFSSLFPKTSLGLRCGINSRAVLLRHQFLLFLCAPVNSLDGRMSKSYAPNVIEFRVIILHPNAAVLYSRKIVEGGWRHDFWCPSSRSLRFTLTRARKFRRRKVHWHINLKNLFPHST